MKLFGDNERYAFSVRSSRSALFYFTENEMIVTFCGHKNLPVFSEELIKKAVFAEAEKLVLEGADTFFLGGYGEFDTVCAVAVRELKRKYSHIRSVLVIPYINRDYNKYLYDESLYPPIENVPLRFAISHRNKYMVKKADVVISYVTHNYGGAYTSLKYAKSQKKRIIEIQK